MSSAKELRQGKGNKGMGTQDQGQNARSGQRNGQRSKLVHGYMGKGAGVQGVQGQGSLGIGAGI